MHGTPPGPTNDLAEAEAQCAADAEAVERVRALLAKADARRVDEPEEARKWNRVLENLEKSLDLTKARHEYAQAVLFRLRQDQPGTLQAPAEAGHSPPPASPHADPADTEAWTATMEEMGKLSLEQASQLQSRIDAGEIHDEQLEAGLTLANQMYSDAEPLSGQRVPRRQHLLRAAIDKIGKRQYDRMSLDEINLVIACHALLTSRLEPTARDRRLRRILDGAIKILRRRRATLEGG